MYQNFIGIDIGKGDFFVSIYGIEGAKSYTNDEEYFFKAISQNIRVDEATLLRNYLIPGKKWYSNENFSSTLPGQSYSYCCT